jgi:hypothetical protein
MKKIVPNCAFHRPKAPFEKRPILTFRPNILASIKSRERFGDTRLLIVEATVERHDPRVFSHDRFNRFQQRDGFIVFQMVKNSKQQHDVKTSILGPGGALGAPDMKLLPFAISIDR